MSGQATRRAFLTGVASAALTGAAYAQDGPRGRIADTPFRVGLLTFFSGPATILGEPIYKGHSLAVQEINARGGLLGKRRIEILKADENAGTDANVKELRRLKLAERIELFLGVTSSGNVPALGPLAEELKVLTLFIEGSTDFLFDKAVPRPHYVFRFGNLQSSWGVSCAVAVARTWPDVRRIAHIHPDYSLGRNVFDHFTVTTAKLMPRAQVVSESWPTLGTTDFTGDIQKPLAANADLVVTSVWGGDYAVFYKQAIRSGMFGRMKLATAVAFGVTPSAIGRDHPEGAIAAAPGSYHFSNPPPNRSPINKAFVDTYVARWREYPNFAAEVAYTATHAFRVAVEKANRLVGGWPDDEAIIKQLEGTAMAGPGGTISVRPENHQGYRDAIVGFSKNVADYPFPILDRVMTIPIRQLTAPPGWPKGEPTSTYTWIERTWTQRGPSEQFARTEPEETRGETAKEKDEKESEQRSRVEFGRYHALVIGNQAYRDPNIPSLRTPIADATAVADLLKREYGFQTVRLLKDATRDQMFQALNDLRRALGNVDNLLIYYAGHGILDEKAERGYWLPVDAERDSPARWLSTADITDTLKALEAKHVLVVADSCYAGALTRDIGTQAFGSKDMARLAAKRARTVLTSGGMEPVADGGGGAHSIFAKVFLEALRQNTDVTDMTALFSAMRRRVIWNASQTPEYYAIRFAGHDGGDFVFVRTKK